MFFSMNTFVWTGAFSAGHLPLLERIKTWGADGVEFARSDFDGFPVASLRRELAQLNLACTMCVSPPTVEESIIHPEARHRRAGQTYLRKAIAVASDIGATVLAGPLYAHVGWFTGARPTDDQFKWAVENFQALGGDLDASGLELAIEPMNRFESFFLPTAADGVRLCEAIDHARIGLLLDTVHMMIEEKDLFGAVRAAGPWLKHLQTSESDRGTPGTAQWIDWRGLFRTLADIGYRGGCAIASFAFQDPEVSAKTWCWRDLAPSPDVLARDGLAFLRRTYTEVSP